MVSRPLARFSTRFAESGESEQRNEEDGKEGVVRICYYFLNAAFQGSNKCECSHCSRSNDETYLISR